MRERADAHLPESPLRKVQPLVGSINALAGARERDLTVARQRAVRRLAMPERSGRRQWSRRPRSWKWPLPVPIEMLIPPPGSSQLPNALLTFTVPVW